MITVTSTTEQVLRELRTEEPKAMYWLKRKHVDREFVSLFEQIFKNVSIKQYNVMEFINYIFEKIKEDTKKFEQEK